MRYSAAVAFEFEADGIMTANKVAAVMARAAEEAVGEARGTVRQIGCLELATPMKSMREGLAESAATLALNEDN